MHESVGRSWYQHYCYWYHRVSELRGRQV